MLAKIEGCALPLVHANNAAPTSRLSHYKNMCMPAEIGDLALPLLVANMLHLCQA